MTTRIDGKAYLTIAEVSKRVGLSRWTTRRLLDNLRIAYVWSGRKIYVSVDSLNSKLRNDFE